jgi:hypothetical protein
VSLRCAGSQGEKGRAGSRQRAPAVCLDGPWCLHHLLVIDVEFRLVIEAFYIIVRLRSHVIVRSVSEVRAV